MQIVTEYISNFFLLRDEIMFNLLYKLFPNCAVCVLFFSLFYHNFGFDKVGEFSFLVYFYSLVAMKYNLKIYMPEGQPILDKEKGLLCFSIID